MGEEFCNYDADDHMALQVIYYVWSFSFINMRFTGSEKTLLAIVMLLTMIAGIFVGIPVSFTLLFLALGFGYISMGESVFSLTYYNLVGTLSNEVFIAIPMFIFMGYICERAGLVEKLFYSMKTVVGNLNIVVIVINKPLSHN